MGSLGTFFQQLFGPIGAIFHVVFYLPIYNVLMLLYLGVHAVAPALPAYAIAIFFLTILIRLCLFPLTRKQLQSSRRMQELAPQLEELKRRHRGNPQEMMAAQQALYRENGVSMYGGCLPLLIQMPFLYGLYYSLYTALLTNSKTETVIHHLQRVNDDIYPFLPHLSALPNTQFLWTNLAAADPWKVLPVLAGVLTFMQLRMAMPVRKKTPGVKSSDPNSQAMGTMQYVMPFITFFMALNFPSGLAFYWAISTAFSAVQQYFLTGWGSLFVGIPGMEHLVPEPAPIATSPARTASALVDGSSRDDRPSGIAGLRQLLSEMAASRSQQADDKQAAKDAPSLAGGSPGGGKAPKRDAGGSVGDAAKARDKAGQNGAPSIQDASAASGGGVSDGSGRRSRPNRQGPTLVKPGGLSSPPGPATDGGAAAGGSVDPNGLKPLDGAANGKGANGTNGTNGINGANGAHEANGALGPAMGSPQRGAAGSGGSGAGPRPQRPSSSQQRGPSGGTSRKRPGGKSKGGR